MRPELRNSKPKRGERAQHRVGFVSFFSLPAECLWSPCHAIYALSHIFYTEPNAICPSTSQQWSCSSCVPKFIFDSFSLYSLKRTVFFSSLLFQKFCFMFRFALSLNRRVTVYSEGFFVVALQLCWLFSLTLSLSLCIFTIIIIPVCFSHICTHTFFIHISNICISVMFIFLWTALSMLACTHSIAAMPFAALVVVAALEYFFHALFFLFSKCCFFTAAFRCCFISQLPFFSLPTPHPLWICIWWISMQMQSESKSKNKREK